MAGEDHKQALPAGFCLGSYRVLRVLGVGGFGVTYLCEHAGLGVQVAVKEYLPNEIAVRDGAAVQPKSASDREGFEWGLGRFLDEARTLARFEHPNVVRVRDRLEANSTAYIVMDYEDGESLDRLLQRLGTLTEAQLKRVVLPVAEGLRASARPSGVGACGYSGLRHRRWHICLQPGVLVLDRTPTVPDVSDQVRTPTANPPSVEALASGSFRKYHFASGGMSLHDGGNFSWLVQGGT